MYDDYFYVEIQPYNELTNRAMAVYMELTYNATADTNRITTQAFDIIKVTGERIPGYQHEKFGFPTISISNNNPTFVKGKETRVWISKYLNRDRGSTSMLIGGYVSGFKWKK